KRLILSFVFSIFVAFFTYVFVDLIQPIIDKMWNVSSGAPPEKTRLMDYVFNLFNISENQIVKFIPLVLVVVIFGKGFFTFLSTFFMKSIGHKVVKDLRDNLYTNLLSQSTRFFDRTSTGELMSRLTNDIDKVREAVSGSMGDVIREALIILVLLVGMFIKDWHMALASFVVAPLAVVPLAAFSVQLRRKGLLNQKRMANIYNLLHESITGNKIVKSFTMEKFEIGKFIQATYNYFKTSIKLAWIGSLSSPFMEFMGGVLGAFILFVGTQRIAGGYLSAGDFGSFMVAIFMMYTPIKRLSRANNVIQQGVAGYIRIREIFEEKTQIKESPDAVELPEVKGEVMFDKVSFSYNHEKPVLHNVSFKVKPAQTVALIGLSGAGKTTIINLISRFYEINSGKIYIDGYDISEVTLNSLRSQIGLVTQELILFNDTVRNNIAYGIENVSKERIKKAAKAAEAHDFIMKLPQKYDTIIGEKGGTLSSGQRQRLAIARAMLKNPPILILDEATSALDSESEKFVQKALANLMKNRTTIVIAHRLSTIRRVNKIIVVDKGKIVEEGTHQYLYRKNGIYRKLYDLQIPVIEEEEL
ncbi:MAG: ABC transporter ATP-binding protein, partial [Candidatus Aminicenantaceae bacterium]